MTETVGAGAGPAPDANDSALAAKLDEATARLAEARPFGKARHRAAVLELARRMILDESCLPEVAARIEKMEEAGIFTTLLAAGEATGLAAVLDAPGDYTIFAPTDDAFAAALEALGLTADELLADTDTLTAILTYHGILGRVDAEAAIGLDGQTAATINGAEIAISVVDGSVVINDSATVIQPDVMASNGIIHVIDTVLLPPS